VGEGRPFSPSPLVLSARQFFGEEAEKAFRATQVSGNAMRTVVLKEGRRDDSTPHQTRRLSMVQLGLRWLRYAVEHGFV